MIIEGTADALWESALGLVLGRSGTDLPSRDGACREVCGVGMMLTDPRSNVVTNVHRRFDPYYVSAELLWCLSGVRTVERLMPFASNYDRFCDTIDGERVAYGAYGYRWEHSASLLSARIAYQMEEDPRGQIELLIELLRNNPGTRQAVLSTWEAGDLLCATRGDKKDLPCQLTCQFLLRDGKLNMIVSQRSNDLWLGFPCDIYVATTLQAMIAESVGARLGSYKHNVGSLHLYHRHKYRAEKAMGSPGRLCLGHDYYEPLQAELLQAAENINRTLEEVRLRSMTPEQLIRTIDLGWTEQVGSHLRDSAILVAHRYLYSDSVSDGHETGLERELLDRLISPLLKEVRLAHTRRA